MSQLTIQMTNQTGSILMDNGLNRHHWAVHPPSTVQLAPVIWRALSVQRKVARAPMSAGTLKLAEGCFSSIRALEASCSEMPRFSLMMSICFWMRGVSTNPGQMALTVTPFLAFSRAAALVNPTIPCLAATQADLLTEATRPWTLATLMILPQPFFFIWGRAYLVPQKAELRLREMTFSQISSGNSSTVLMCCMPALLTRISTFPKWAMDCSIRFLVSLGLVRSAKMNLAEEVWLVSSFSRALISASGAKPLRTTLEPAADRARATPRPMPEREPVTTAVLPLRNVPNMTSIKYIQRDIISAALIRASHQHIQKINRRDNWGKGLSNRGLQDEWIGRDLLA